MALPRNDLCLVPGARRNDAVSERLGGPSIDVSTDDVLSGLKMAFMAHLNCSTANGRTGRLGVCDLGSDKSGTRQLSIHGQPLPVGVNANLSLDVKANILTLGGTYSFIEKPEYTLGMIFGARMLSMDQTLNWSFVGRARLESRVRHVGRQCHQLDAIVGVRGAPASATTALVRSVLRRCRHWQLAVHVAGAGWSGLLLQLGRRACRVALSRLRVQVGDALQSLDFNGAAWESASSSDGESNGKTA